MRTVPIVILSFLIMSTISITANAQEVSPIILTQIELVTVSESEFEVTWITNLPSDSRVNYGTTVELNESHQLVEQTLFHHIRIEGLESGTTYHYRVGSNGQYSEIYTFRTLYPEGNSKDLTIALVGDAHIDMDGQNTASGSMNSQSDTLFESTISQLIRDEETDLVIFLGDMVNGASEDYVEFFDTLSTLNKPSEFTFGNWEKNEDNWNDIAGRYLDTTATYHSFDKKGYHFIILDSAVHGEVGGSMNSTQFQWLRDDLYRNRDEPTLVFMHHPLEDEGIFTVDDTTKKELNDIFNRNGQIISVFAGHNHKNTIVNVNDRFHCSVASLVQYPIGYSRIRLYDEGFTQHFLKVSSEVQTSEESKLLLDASGGSTNAHEEYLGELDQRSWFHSIMDERPPVIDSIELSPDTCYGGDRVDISIDAYDPDHEELSYSYLIDGKSSEESESSFTIKAPVDPGEYSINITVKAGSGSTWEETVLTVVNDSVKIDRPPVINELKADKYRVAPGGTVRITVAAMDPDDDTISFQWKVNDELLNNGESTLEWTAPETIGTYNIGVVVTANGKTAEKSISIIVEQGVTSGESDKKETPFGFSILLFGLIISLLILGRYRMKKSS